MQNNDIISTHLRASAAKPTLFLHVQTIWCNIRKPAAFTSEL